MKTAIRMLLVLTVSGATAAAQSPAGDVLSIYLVDVEGGGDLHRDQQPQRLQQVVRGVGVNRDPFRDRSAT